MYYLQELTKNEHEYQIKILIYQTFAVITKVFVNLPYLRGVIFHNIMSHMTLFNFCFDYI